MGKKIKCNEFLLKAAGERETFVQTQQYSKFEVPRCAEKKKEKKVVTKKMVKTLDAKYLYQ